MSKQRSPGELLVFLGAALWSLNAPLVKLLAMDSLLICGLRSAIAAVALIGFLRPRRLKWNGWMLLYVCSYAALSLSIIVALSLTAAPIAIGMQYTATIWLFLANLLVTKRFNVRAFIPVGIIFVGVVIFMCSGAGDASGTGNLIALCEGVFFAGITVGAKKAAGTNPIGLTAVANLFTGLVMLLVFPGILKGIPAMTGMDWGVMLILGVFQIGLGYALYNMGVQKVSAQKASIISLWEMILGPVWVALLLKEYPSVPVLIGFVIILTGIFLDHKLNKAAPAMET